MAGFLLAPCGNVHLVEMCRQGKQDADMRVRKNYGLICMGKSKAHCICSCNPQTLARDLKYLAKKGYHTKQATPVDMFPWTKAEHVETVCLLEKGKKVMIKNIVLDIGNVLIPFSWRQHLDHFWIFQMK